MRRLVSSAVDGVPGVGVVVRVEVTIRLVTDAVPRLDVDAQPVSFPEDHARRPDLYPAFDRLVTLQPPALVVRVIRTIGQRTFRVKLAVIGVSSA